VRVLNVLLMFFGMIVRLPLQHDIHTFGILMLQHSFATLYNSSTVLSVTVIIIKIGDMANHFIKFNKPF